MLDFQLFRIQVFPSGQLSFIDDELTKKDLLIQTLLSLISKDEQQSNWHLGNDEKIDNNSYYFCLGRTSQKKSGHYKDGKFIDQEFETSPYTHLFIDIDKELCAIARKNEIAPSPYSLSRRLLRIMNKSYYAQNNRVYFEIKAIPDPKDFISYIHRAYSISKVWFNFGLPNAFDKNKDFHEPLGVMLRELKGKDGKIVFDGNELDCENIESISRSIASTGNDASATLKMEERGTKIIKKLKGNNVIIPVESIESSDEKDTFILEMRNVYTSIRGTFGA